MSELRLKSSLTMDEIESNFKDADFFSGVMDGLEEALAHKKGKASAETLERERSLPAMDTVGDVNIMTHKFTEDDGSVTLSLDAIDLVANGENLQTAMANLVDDLIEYAKEYQRNFEAYHSAPNREEHMPLVERVLSAASKEELMNAIQFIE